jgi:hypothetical protein
MKKLKISMNFSGEIDDRKRTEEGKKYFQNKTALVSKKRGRYRSGYTYLLLSKTVRAVSCGQDGQRLHRNNFTGSSHKIPQMSYLRYETPAIFRQVKQRCR